jgi:hypothetical protein
VYRRSSSEQETENETLPHLDSPLPILTVQPPSLPLPLQLQQVQEPPSELKPQESDALSIKPILITTTCDNPNDSETQLLLVEPGLKRFLLFLHFLPIDNYVTAAVQFSLAHSHFHTDFKVHFWAALCRETFFNLSINMDTATFSLHICSE